MTYPDGLGSLCAKYASEKFSCLGTFKSDQTVHLNSRFKADEMPWTQMRLYVDTVNRLPVKVKDDAKVQGYILTCYCTPRIASDSAFEGQ